MHREFDDYIRLDRRLQWELKRKWEEIQDYYQSVNLVNYYPNDDFDESQRKLMEELDDYLDTDHYSKFVDKDEEEFNKRRCRLLGITYNEPPLMISEKFEVIKYSLGPYEEYVAMKTKEYVRLSRSEENVAELYGNIFCMTEEGWHVVRTK